MKEIIYQGSTRDNGNLTKISKFLNEKLGDDSGRSITNRTAQGFKKTFNLNIIDDRAEDIVHLGMILSPIMLNSPSKKTRTTGALIAATLFISYQNGKNIP